MKLKAWILPLLLPVQILIISGLSKYQDWIETNYSLTFYPKISRLLRSIFGVFPFSVGDILYLILAINIIALLLKWRKGKTNTIGVLRIALKFASVIYFLFHFFWGLNYYRKPLHKVLEIDHTYTTAQLEKVSLLLLEKSNQLHEQITVSDTLAVKITFSTNEIFDASQMAYQGLSKEFPELTYQPVSIKKSMLSLPLTYMGFGGYLNPFTNEAQVNKLIVPYKVFTTSCHEIAHQLGFAKENEANFIGVLACIKSDDLYFKYSGYTFALRYCLAELHRRDYQKYSCIKEKINVGILKNYQENKIFWEAYENPLEPYFKQFYDQFLKVNNQEKGIESYSYVVALFVNYFDRE